METLEVGSEQNLKSIVISGVKIGKVGKVGKMREFQN